MATPYDAPELIYTDDDVDRADAQLWSNWGNDPDNPPADCQWAARIVLDATAPRIAERVLRDLVRHCFDEHDALVATDGIATVERYVNRRLAELKRTGA